MKVVYSERARHDIADIYDSITPHSSAAAQRVEDFIRSTAKRLADFPYASVATDEPNVRRLPLVRFPYTIYCRVDAVCDFVEIARVIHSARIRDLRRLPETE